MSGEEWGQIVILVGSLVLLGMIPLAFVVGRRDGRRQAAWRVGELEGALAESERRRWATTRMRRAIDMRLKNQRRELAVLREQRDAVAGLPRELADDIRLLLASKDMKLHEGVVHDGNHDRCDACAVYRAAEAFCTQPWHHVIRQHGKRRTVAHGGS